MLTALQTAFTVLLKSSLPSLFDGDSPAVTLAFPPYQWDFDPSSADATAGEPSQDDAVDSLAFDPASPQGPYALTRPPYPGPKRIYLLGPGGDRVTLAPGECVWDPLAPGSFTLAPKPARALAGLDTVEVHYGVTAVFTKLKSAHQLGALIAAADDAKADEAEALALAVFALNREAIKAAGGFSHAGGGYTAQGEIKTLKLRKGNAPGPGSRILVLEAEVEMKVGRALNEDEGTPILRILSPGAAPGPDRKVDIDIGVEA
jgi:hypothetical protein